jgi:hypothetical protein
MLCVFVGWWCHSSCHVWLPYVSDPCWNEICSHSIFTVPHSVHLPWQYVYRLLAIFLGSPCYCLHKLGCLMMNIRGLVLDDPDHTVHVRTLQFAAQDISGTETDESPWGQNRFLTVSTFNLHHFAIPPRPTPIYAPPAQCAKEDPQVCNSCSHDIDERDGPSLSSRGRQATVEWERLTWEGCECCLQGLFYSCGVSLIDGIDASVWLMSAFEPNWRPESKEACFPFNYKFIHRDYERGEWSHRQCRWCLTAGWFIAPSSGLGW